MTQWLLLFVAVVECAYVLIKLITNEVHTLGQVDLITDHGGGMLIGQIFHIKQTSSR